MCDNPKQELKHKGKYHISLRDKKVYDLEERRLFCCDKCFQASNSYKSQLDTAPLWLRDTDKTSIGDFHAISEPEHEIIIEPKLEKQNSTSKSTEKEMPSEKIMESLLKYNQVEEEKPVSETMKEVLTHWFTLDSYRVLYGDQSLKLRLREAGAAGEGLGVLDTGGNQELAEQYQASYRDICRKLDLMDLLEETEHIEDNQHLPLPSYEMLRQHCEDENSKMGAFLDGKQSYRRDTVTGVVEKDTDLADPRLPLIDHNSQLQLRRRLVSDSLHRTYTDLLKIMKISLTDISNDLKELIESFQISSTTVVFKSEVWTLIAITLLRLLSVKNPSVSSVFTDDQGMKYLTLILLSFQCDLSSLDQMIRDVTSDIKSLLSKYKIR